MGHGRGRREVHARGGAPGLRRGLRPQHNVPRIPDPEEEVKWMWDEDYEDAFLDEGHAYTPESCCTAPVLVLCNHCTSPPA